MGSPVFRSFDYRSGIHMAFKYLTMRRSDNFILVPTVTAQGLYNLNDDFAMLILIEHIGALNEFASKY